VKWHVESRLFGSRARNDKSCAQKKTGADPELSPNQFEALHPVYLYSRWPIPVGKGSKKKFRRMDPRD
jgi:hypothetical protein